MRKSGVYKIESISHPERIYVGSSLHIDHRWSGHLSDLKRNKHHSFKLQRHYDKYGKLDLKFSIIKLCEKEQLIKYEQESIERFKPYFNINPNAIPGHTHSEESKLKMSIAKKGKPGNRKGAILSDESKLKMSLAKLGKTSTFKGKTFSEETILKMCGKNNHQYKNGKYVGRSAARKKKLKLNQ